jgi:hypothetical protein
MTKSGYEGSAHALRVDKPGFPRHDVNGVPAFFHQGLRGFNAQALNRAVESEPGLAANPPDCSRNSRLPPACSTAS